MKRNNNILTIAVVLLLLTNIALVVFMFMGKNKHDGKPRVRRDPFDAMAKELSMTEQQQKDFKQLREDHFKNIRPHMDSVSAAKTAFFSLIKDPAANDSLVNAYNNRVMLHQSELEKMTFEHFRRVRNLFTAEQQPKFDSFMQKMFQRRRGDTTRQK